MAENETPPPQPAVSEQEAQPSALNDQVRDALLQLNAILNGTDTSTFQAVAYQTFVHVVALALHNAVAEQQQNHMLRMALTTSAAKAILVGRKAEAESILELAKSPLVSPDLSGLMAQVRELIETVGREVAKTKPATPQNPAQTGGTAPQ